MNEWRSGKWQVTSGGVTGSHPSNPDPNDSIIARLSPICALCLAPFREGDPFKAIYQRRAAPSLSVTVHQACFRQLQPGDLTLVFRWLQQGLQIPLVELRRLRHLRLL